MNAIAPQPGRPSDRDISENRPASPGYSSAGLTSHAAALRPDEQQPLDQSPGSWGEVQPQRDRRPIEMRHRQPHTNRRSAQWRELPVPKRPARSFRPGNGHKSRCARSTMAERSGRRASKSPRQSDLCRARRWGTLPGRRVKGQSRVRFQMSPGRLPPRQLAIFDESVCKPLLQTFV